MTKTFKRIMCSVLALLMLSTFRMVANAAYTPVTLEEVIEAASNASDITKEWYGTTDGIVYADSISDVTLPDGIVDSLALYKVFREGNYLKLGAESIALQRGLWGFLDLEAALKDYNARAALVDSMEERMLIDIVSANITLTINKAEVVDGKYRLFVNEWTFYDYDDLEVDGITLDVSGYGVDHDIVFVQSGLTWLIESDTYLDDMLESAVFLESESSGKTLKDGGLLQAGLKSVTGDLSQTTKYTRYSAYNPQEAVTYSDKWVYHGATASTNYSSYYNPAYYNFNDLGGDCANYTSQSIYAGGMPQVVGTAYGSDGWYYKTSSNRSATWTGAKQLRSWMGANRGAMVTATASSSWMGCPMFVDWTADGVYDHAYFCVGLNTSGTPIINSHNYDKYHVKWNYGGSGCNYSTVQLTSYNHALKEQVNAPTVTVSTVVAYGESLSVSWGAVTNANSYTYSAVLYQGEMSATTATTIVSSSTTSTSFTVPAQSSGKYIKITVTAVGTDDSASTTKNVMVGPYYGSYPSNVQYIPVNDINGSTSASNSTIWTSSNASTFSAVYWRAFMCSPNTDGTYKVTSVYENGASKSVTVSGTNILIAVHSSYANYDYCKDIVVGDNLTLCGIYLDVNTIRGTGHILVNGGIPLGPDSLSIKSDGGISFNNSYVSGTAKKTTVGDFIAKFNEDSSYIVIKNSSGTAVSSGYVCTGYTVNLVVNSKTIKSYTITVTGDVNGDGDVTASDLLILSSTIKSRATLSGAYKEAGDVDSSGNIATSDYLGIKKMI